MSGVEKRPTIFAIVNASTNVDGDVDLVEDVDPPTSVHVGAPIAPSVEQFSWNGKDAHADALIAFSQTYHCSPHSLLQNSEGCLGS